MKKLNLMVIVTVFTMILLCSCAQNKDVYKRQLRYSGYKAAVITALAYSAITLAVINSLPLCSSFC